MAAGRRPGGAGSARAGSRDTARAGARPGAGARTGVRPAPSVAGRGGARPQSSPRGSRSLRVAVLGAVVAVLAVLLAPAMRSYLAQRAQITELRQHVAEQRSQVSALQKERAAWDDPAYVVAQARDRLKFVMPGERAYTVIDPAPKQSTSKPVSPIKAAERTATSDRAWYSDVWRSAQIAGQASSKTP